jgi:hypothetical protein
VSTSMCWFVAPCAYHSLLLPHRCGCLADSICQREAQGIFQM